MIEEYFNPVSSKILDEALKLHHNCIGRNINNTSFDSHDLKEADIAIFGVEEDRNAKGNWGAAHAPDFVRKSLYKLFTVNSKQRIIDLGNMRAGLSVIDTYYGMAEICRELMSYNTIPLIIGGSQDLTIAQFMGAEALGSLLELMVIDSKIDISDDEQDRSTPDNYLNHLFVNHSNNLFHFVNAGNQEYLNDSGTLEMLENVFFEAIPLGALRADLKEFEPYIRSIDLLSFDISAIRYADSPGLPNANPNGFFAHEACQLARYAGLSEKLSSIGFYNFNPTFDQAGVSANLIAQMSWYFMEGFYNRLKDVPPGDNSSYLKYIARIKHRDQDIIFYRNKRSDRWWMEVPIEKVEGENAKTHLIPCSYGDYLKVSLEQDYPDKWLKSQRKFAKSPKN